MSNFPPNRKFTGTLIASGELGQEESGLELSKRLFTFRHAFIMKLIECGVLPNGCGDFTINVPVAGVMSITATYFIEQESFDKAIRETFADPKSATYVRENAAQKAKHIAQVSPVPPPSVVPLPPKQARKRKPAGRSRR